MYWIVCYPYTHESPQKGSDQRSEENTTIRPSGLAQESPRSANQGHNLSKNTNDHQKNDRDIGV